MCIAIYKPQGLVLTEETLKNSWDGNPHGAGFMYAEDNQLTIVKGLMTYEDFLEKYTPHQEKAACLHFRIATHGATNEINTHPFSITTNLGMVHNGIITNSKLDIDPTMSDTWHFVEKILKPLVKQNKTFSPEVQALLEVYIGFSKVVIMDKKGTVLFLNEKSGLWADQCWFSNTSYQTKPHWQFRKQQNKIETEGFVPLGYLPTPRESKKKPKSNLLLVIGDLVKIDRSTSVLNPDWEGEKLASGTVVKITAFCQHQHIRAINLINSKEISIPLWQVDAIEEEPPIVPNNYQKGGLVVFKNNYNHFRIGDTVTVHKPLQRFTIVTTSPNSKFYSIPNTHITAANNLFMEEDYVH